MFRAKISSVLKGVFGIISCLTAASSPINAQLPTCIGAGGFIYIHNGNNIYNYDPALPISGTNPSLNTITMPSGAGGLAVSENLNAATPNPTFYTTVGGNYYYYDGTTWVNTGHGTGNGAAVNPGGGGGYIYNLVGASGDVYIYDGTGTGTFLTTVTGFNGGGPYDLQVDCNGNFYILQLTSPASMKVYSPTGTLLNTYTVTSPSSASAGGGFGVIGNTVFVHNTNGFGIGTITGNNVTFAPFSTFPTSASDFASCPIGGLQAVGANDTFFHCVGGLPIQLSATGGAPYNWTIQSGSATFSGNGQTVDVTASTTTLITVTSDASAACGGPSGNVTDTFYIRVPTAIVDAGTSPDSIRGCGVYTKALNASVFNTTPGLTYNYTWAPAGAIATGGNTLQPVITPTGNMPFILTVSTDPNEGGCVWTDTVEVVTVDRSVTPDFDFDINYGCNEDTVQFNNLSTLGTFYRWDFSDGTGDTAMNPLKIYPNQNAYNVKLVVENETCIDSVTKVVDTQHPLAASFSPDMDSVCEGAMISFTNTSTYTTIEGPASFFWDFGDGTTDTLENTTHVYTAPGEYEVMMVVTDFVPCSDTSYHTIVIDPYPVVDFTTSDSVLCEGQFIEFTAHYTDTGFVDLAWDFGDGKTLSGGDVVAHGYDTSGVFTITLTTNYRICPQQVVTRDVMIYPFPTLNLGPDTTLCPNGEGLLIGDRTNQFTSANWNWNTGDTTAFIVVRHPGIYSAKVSRNGCSTDDSVEVSKDCYLDIPNSFTPNGDGVNDYFLPRQHLSRGLTEFKMVIFNRWGQVIFETQSIDGRGWDGKFNGEAQPTGVYVYQIEAAFKNGVREQYTGNVTLIR